MHEVALDLLILLAGIWLVAVTLRPLGLPTVMGELIVGVLVGPAVFGLIAPNDAITLLAEIGIFFLMFHAGVETQPLEFFHALKRSLGVAVVGAAVPFAVSFAVASAFGLDWVGATFVGLTMTATAVVITLKSLKDLGLANTRVARVIVASCVIDDLLTLVFFGLVIGVLSGGTFEPLNIVVTLGKVVGFFGISVLIGRFVYPRLTLPFRSEGGKGFTFVLLTAIAMGLFAEAIGLHMILGAYLAGLFFEKKVAHPNLVRVVMDRTYGIAYSFLGPIFFISLGFSITFDISASGTAFLVLLTTVVIVGQIVSAGGMALQMGLPAREALTVGVGMCGRAELAFILASLALAQGAIGQPIFSVLIFTAFLLNLFTPVALKGCAVLLEGRAARQEGATRGILQVDKFKPSFSEERFEGVLPHALPDLEGGVVIYGYGPEVESLMSELESRGLPTVVIEENEAVARRLHERGQRVVHATLAEKELDLGPLARARVLVANGEDDANAVFTLEAREQGFGGPIVALVRNPHRRTPMLLAGATATFTPAYVLAAAIAARASTKINPRVAGMQPLGRHLEVAELRVHSASPLANRTLAKAGIRAQTGANIVGQWFDDTLRSPPAADEALEPDTILVAVGSPDSIRGLRELARPITQAGRLIVAGFGDVGQALTRYLTDAGEEVCVIDIVERAGVDVVGDVLDRRVLERASVADARAVMLALGNDSTTQFAATVVRSYSPDLPIIAGVTLSENVGRIQKAGVDFAISVSQVAGQLLAHHVLGETVSLQPRIKLVKTRPGPLKGKNPLAARIRERTGCSVVAVERGDQILMDFPPSFALSPDDALYICGTIKAVNLYYDEYPATRL
jgi:Kef-type K+ transport system membrane component KefB/Trk K+ transport system NAD-binding subunit